MATVVLSRALTSADDGSHTWTLNFTQNGVTVSEALSVSIVSAVPLPTPTGVSLSPTSVTLPDNSAAGTLVTTATITMSDGSTFAGTMTATDETGAAAPVQLGP